MPRNFDYTFTDVELADELTHHGRKGMKWYQHIYGRVQVGGYAKGASTKGVKKGSAKGESENAKTPQKKERKSRQVEEYDKMKQKRTRDLTDQEIDRLMKRMDLEQRLNNKRYEASKTKFDKFMDKYGDVLMRESTNFLKDQGSKVVDKMLEKALGEGTAKDARKITREMADQVKNEADYYQNINRRDAQKAQYEKARTPKETPKQESKPESKPETKSETREQAENTQANKAAERDTSKDTPFEQYKGETDKNGYADPKYRRVDSQKDQFGYIRRRRYRK